MTRRRGDGECCPGEPAGGDPRGLHSFDCPIIDQWQARFYAEEARRLRTPPPGDPRMSHPPEGLLPPFPVDPSTLDLIETALHPGPTSQTSSVGQLCDLYSALAGSDLDAVDHVSDGGVRVMRDPHYHPNDIIDALLAEVRRLRAHPDPPGGSP